MATHKLVEAQIKRVEALWKELESGKVDAKSAGRPLELRHARLDELKDGIVRLERGRERAMARFDTEIADLKREIEALQKDSGYKEIEKGQGITKRKSPASKTKAKAKTKATQRKQK